MEDIGPLILRYIDCGSDYKSCALVSHQWNNWARLAHPCADTNFANHLATLLKMFPDGSRWAPDYLSSNPSITAEFIREHLDWDWSWIELMSNPTLSWADIVSLPEYQRAKQYAVGHPEFPFATTNLTKSIKNYWDHLSYNPSLTWDYILQNLDNPWDWNTLSHNTNLTIDIILQNMDAPWNWYALSYNSAITWQNIHDHPELPWCYEYIVYNPNVLPEEFAKVIADSEFFEDMSDNPNITWDFVRAHPEVKWEWHTLAKYLPLSIDIFEHIEFYDDWTDIPRNNSTVTLELVRQFIDRGWKHWTVLLCSAGITWDDIMSLPMSDDVGAWAEVCRNPNLTWRNVADNPTLPWLWEFLSCNTFGKKKR